jgi:hypothetical protein
MVQAVVLHIREQDLETINKEPARCIEEVEELLLVISREKDNETGSKKPAGPASRKRGRPDNTVEGNRYRFVWNERPTNPRPTILVLRSNTGETISGKESTDKPCYCGGRMLKQTLIVRLNIMSEKKDIQSYFT